MAPTGRPILKWCGHVRDTYHGLAQTVGQVPMRLVSLFIATQILELHNPNSMTLLPSVHQNHSSTSSMGLNLARITAEDHKSLYLDRYAAGELISRPDLVRLFAAAFHTPGMASHFHPYHRST